MQSARYDFKIQFNDIKIISIKPEKVLGNINSSGRSMVEGGQLD